MRPGRRAALLVVSPRLDRGGMELQLLTLARAFAREVGQVRCAAGPGALEPEFRSVGELASVRWEDDPEQTAAQVARLADEDTVAVLQADPRTLHLVLALVARCPVHLCVHNRPGTFERWFDELSLRRLRAFVPPLVDARCLALTAASSPHARGYDEELGLPTGTVQPWLPGVTPDSAAAPSSGPIRRVVVVARLSDEKLPMVLAGAELVAAGRRGGHDVVLDVYGEGPAAATVRAALGEALDAGAFRLAGPTGDPVGAARSADVVVNSGRSAIEAMLAGRRVVTVRLGPSAPYLGEPVTPETFARLKEANFSSDARLPDGSADDVWRALSAIELEDVAALKRRAEQELSDRSVLAGHMTIRRTLSPLPRDAALAVEAAVAERLQIEREQRRLKLLADQLWAERQAR